MRDVASIKPILAGMTAIAALSAMDAVIKEAAGHHSTTEVVMMRYFFGILATLPFLFLSGARLPTIGTFKRAAVRTVFILSTAFLFFKTLELLPLAEAVSITFTAPFFMLLVSRVLLGEKIPPRALIAIAVGFIGVLIMVWGQLKSAENESFLGYVTGIGASITYAMASIMTRRDTGYDPVVPMVVAQNLLAWLASTPLGLASLTWPDGYNWLLFALAGMLGTVGQLVFAWAYSRAPASRLAPLEYTAFLWASLLGVVFFKEIPATTTFTGAGLIVFACLLVVPRPRRESSSANP